MTAEHDKKRTAQHVDRLMARLKAAERERDSLRADKQHLIDSIREELDEGLRLRELGGAGPDESITAMTERVIRERDALAQHDDPVAQCLARMWLRMHYSDDFDSSDIESMCWSILGCEARAKALHDGCGMPMNEAINLAGSEQTKEPPAAVVRSVSAGKNGVNVTWLGGFPQIGMKLYATPQPSPVSRPMPETYIDALVRSVQPNLDAKCKAWKRLAAQCRYWLEVERAHSIGASQQPSPAAQIPEEATLPMLKAYVDALRAGCELDGSTVWRVMLAAARGVEPCSCDQRGIGVPGVTCGDCPRDYGSKA